MSEKALCVPYFENYGNGIWNVLGHVWKWLVLGEEIKR